MDVKCQICQHKDQEIIFLRSLVESMIEQKKLDDAYYYPTSINDHGEVVNYRDPEIVEADDIVIGENPSGEGASDAS